MNRVEIKRQAKEIASRNKMNIWAPLLGFFAIAFFVGRVGSLFFGDTLIESVLSLAISVISLFFQVAFLKYVIDILSGQKDDFMELFKDIFENKFRPIALVTAIVFLITFAALIASSMIAFPIAMILTDNVISMVLLGMVIMMVPVLVVSYMLYMVYYILATRDDLESFAIVKESIRLMRGYKLNLAIFQLSFLPLFIICLIPLGLGLIWFVPYYTAAEALYFQKLVEVKSNE